MIIILWSLKLLNRFFILNLKDKTVNETILDNIYQGFEVNSNNDFYSIKRPIDITAVVQDRYDITKINTKNLNDNFSPGQSLLIQKDIDDPDEIETETISYSWQTSSDNNTWEEVSTGNSYVVDSTDEGKSIKAVIFIKTDKV